MKPLSKSILLIIIVLSSCNTKQPQTNTFSSSEDTLILETTKIGGHGLFRIGAGQLTFRDTVEWKNILDWYDFQFKYPDNLENPKIGLTTIMFDPLKYFDKIKHDIIQKNLSRQENTIGIVTGIIDNNEVFIFDENNNRDFCDDKVRAFNEWDWMSDENLIKCRYIIEKREETIADSGWVKIGKWQDRILISTCQHLVANFFIDDIHYKLGVVDENSSGFCFLRPAFALLGENEVLRDTLLERDLLKLGEYIKLGKSYFEINDLYSGSGHVVVVKTEDFESKVGVQVGAIAPSFKFISTKGDTICSSDYKSNDYVMTNISGCTSRSFDVFKKIQDTLDNKLKLIGINSGVNKDLEGVLIDVEDQFNNEVYINYRNAYSSYDCYLINKDGRIIDKFSIFDWESHLNEFIK